VFQQKVIVKLGGLPSRHRLATFFDDLAVHGPQQSILTE
jgi:hypothetical protein